VMRALLTIAVGIMSLSLCAAPVTAADAPKEKRERQLRISVSTALFDGRPARLAEAMMQPFPGFLKLQSGLDGQMIAAGDGLACAAALADGKVDIAVMAGIEFAWAREQDRELRPLLIAVNQKTWLRSYLVVRKGGTKMIADLQGKTIANHRYLRLSDGLYLERACRQQAGKPSREFFGKVITKDFAEEMLDDVIDRVADAAVVEEVVFEAYQRRKPARFKDLVVLEKSEQFPASVACYRAGRVDDKTLKALHDGMLGAGSSSAGRQLLMLWQITAFQNPPAEFEGSLTAILKAYPPPERAQAALPQPVKDDRAKVEPVK
jgi:ABC-type phosphate/phosphonate transport system substrate-binding protein